VNSFAQRAGAFPMDDPNAANSFTEALGEVFRQQIADLRGAESVEIEL
jgi:hypothetical protein